MKNILMIGTGGTIASKQTEYGLAPGLSTEDILNYIPAVSKICEVDSIQVCNLDSTNVTPEHWKLLVKTVEENYDKYDGFVICHGTDTLAYTAAALSYMIQNSRKPIVVTGAQKPIEMDVTDAKQICWTALSMLRITILRMSTLCLMEKSLSEQEPEKSAQKATMHFVVLISHIRQSFRMGCWCVISQRCPIVDRCVFIMR